MMTWQACLVLIVRKHQERTLDERLDLIAYRRVSTNGQVDKYGLPTQLTDMRGFAKRNHHRIIRVETDEGLSGELSEDDRPALFACLRAIRDGEAQGLLLPSLNRLARLLTVQEAVLAQVWKLGGRVFTADTGEILADDPDDPMRTAIRQMMGVFAQLDRALLVKKLRNGRAEKAKQGGYAYGSPAFGQMAKDHELAENPDEQLVIDRMRELRSTGLSYAKIADELNERHMLPKRGGRWHAQTVSRAVNR
jgi:DNA invertase Pin-like site-specific DNA recombinase